MQKKDKIIFIVASIVTFSLVFMLAATKGSSFGTLCLLIMAVYIIYGVCLIHKYVSKGKKDKQLKMEKYGATLTGTLKHTSGLPIAKGVFIDVYYCPDKFVFKKDGQEFTIAREKITSVDVVTGQNIKSQLMAGAATGKYLFGGTTGAVIGSLAATTTYFAVSYISDGKDKCVLLDTASSGMFAIKVQKDFAKTGAVQRRSVEL